MEISTFDLLHSTFYFPTLITVLSVTFFYNNLNLCFVVFESFILSFFQITFLVVIRHSVVICRIYTLIQRLSLLSIPLSCFINFFNTDLQKVKTTFHIWVSKFLDLFKVYFLRISFDVIPYGISLKSFGNYFFFRILVRLFFIFNTYSVVSTCAF